MTPKEVVEAVFKLIDEECAPDVMSKEEYLSVLEDVRDDADMRAETVKSEIEDEENE